MLPLHCNLIILLTVAGVVSFRLIRPANKLGGSAFSTRSGEAAWPFRRSTENNRRIFTVFSTECSLYHDWQSTALAYVHKTRGLEGEVVRLMSCGEASYTPPQHSHERYRVVRTPNFNARFPQDNFPPRNKANALSYWLHGYSGDMDLPEDDDVIIVVDPDHIFLSNDFNVSSVRTGVGIASKYGLGGGWVKQWAVPFCGGKCDVLEADYDPSWGVPHILTAGDTRRHSDLWLNLTEEMRSEEAHKGWMTEMYSAIIVARRLDLRITVQGSMLSNVYMDSEPWEHVGWHTSPPGAVPVAHYCQEYQVSTFRWGKWSYGDLDIRRCDRSVNFPSPNASELDAMEHSRNGPLKPPNASHEAYTIEAVHVNRNVWLLDNTWGLVREAINAYYRTFCPMYHKQENPTTPFP